MRTRLVLGSCPLTNETTSTYSPVRACKKARRDTAPTAYASCRPAVRPPYTIRAGPARTNTAVALSRARTRLGDRSLYQNRQYQKRATRVRGATAGIRYRRLVVGCSHTTSTT